MNKDVKIIRRVINNQEIYIYNSKKYKTIYTSINFYIPFNKDYIAPLCLLSRLMGKTTVTYRTEQSLKNKLQECYDSSMFGLLRKQGDTIVFSFFLSCINPIYLMDSSNLYEEVTDLFSEAFMKFKVYPEAFDKEKRLLILALDNMMNDKYSYAMNHFMKIMFENEDDSYSMYGEKEDILNLTIDDVTSMYNMLFNEAHSLFVSGDITSNEENIITRKFCLNSVSNDSLSFVTNSTKKVVAPKVIKEDIATTQSIVVMGFRTKYRIYKKNIQTMQLFQQMLGGAFSSSLPQIVRENAGLAYSVSSSFDNRNGVLLIVASISKENYEKYIDLVEKILQSYKDGIVDDELFFRSKEQIKADILQSVDNPLLGYYQMVAKVSGHTPKSTQELIHKYEIVQKEEIQVVAKACVLDTTYYLKGDKDE